MVLAAEKVVASNLTVGDWIAALAVLAGGFALGMILRGVLLRALGRSGDSGDSPDRVDEDGPQAAEMVGRIVTTVAFAAAFLYALSILGIRLGPLVGALGIGGLAIAFAAQSILANFLASVILQVRRAFRRGDLIETNECEGTVEDVNFRTVVLRTYDGEKVMVPCAEVLSKPIINYSTMGRRRTSLEIGISYDADPGKARDVLLEAVRPLEGVRDVPPPEVWVKAFGESSVDLAVRFWHAPDIPTMWRVRSDVAIAAKRALEAAGITIPFPQRVLHFSDSRNGERDGTRDGDHETSERDSPALL